MKENFGDNIYNKDIPNDSTPEDIRVSQEESEKKALENKESFFARLEKEGLLKESLQNIDFAYDLSKAAHRLQVRDTGERYFEHLRAVALILIDECKMQDPEMIIAALNHDAIEDTAIFGNRSTPFSQWKETADFRLSKAFNPSTANMVITLTKPKADGVEIRDDKEAHDIYINNLKNTKDLRIIIIKMADRLHNLRTLPGTTPEKQRRIVKETEEIYFPIFKRALEQYPEQGNYLLDEMMVAISLLDIDKKEMS